MSVALLLALGAGTAFLLGSRQKGTLGETPILPPSPGAPGAPAPSLPQGTRPAPERPRPEVEPVVEVEPPDQNLPPVAMLREWQSVDFIKRPFGNNVGGLSSAGALRLREQLAGSDILDSNSNVTDEWSLTQYRTAWFPFKQQDPVSALGFFEYQMRLNQTLILVFDPRDFRISTMNAQANQPFYLAGPSEASFTQDPIGVIRGIFTGTQPKVYPSLEGKVFVTYQEARALGVFRGEY